MDCTANEDNKAFQNGKDMADTSIGKLPNENWSLESPKSKSLVGNVRSQ